jgi:hypothetical protein
MFRIHVIICTALALKFVYALYLNLTTKVFLYTSIISYDYRKTRTSQRDTFNYSWLAKKLVY